MLPSFAAICNGVNPPYNKLNCLTFPAYQVSIGRDLKKRTFTIISQKSRQNNFNNTFPYSKNNKTKKLFFVWNAK